jgi:hypothetical protein
MKTKLLLSVLLSFVFYLLSSQVPQGFNYQAIARNADNDVMANKVLQVRITLQTTITGGTKIWEETHPVTTNDFGLMSFVIGSGTWTGGLVTLFSDINWSLQPLYLKTEVNPGTGYVVMGTSQLWSVPYSLIAKDLDGPVEKLGVTGVTDNMEEALFEVKNKTGQTVFAVYNEGVRVYVDNGAKGIKGGFAIGGFDKTKDGINQDYFIVNRDSVRVYLDTLSVKTRKGGFAIGGFDRTNKGIGNEYLRVTRDSTRVYINDLPGKTRKGGFAIGGFNLTKAGNKSFLNVATDATGIINPPQNRVLWYPIKNAFLAGRVRIGTPDSVGENSFSVGYQSKARGKYSQAMGFKAIANGDYSTAIGKNAVANNNNSFSFGDSPLASGLDSYAFGAGAIATGVGSYALGSDGRDINGDLTGAKTTASGNYSFAIGSGSVASETASFASGFVTTASGKGSTAIGFGTIASGQYSTALGTFTRSYGTASTSMGLFAVSNSNSSTAIGMLTSATGEASTALGYSSVTNANYATAMGYSTSASGTGSTAMGLSTAASGTGSTAMGNSTTASGYNSTALGENTTAQCYASLVIGRYNLVYGLSNEWNFWDPLFVVGNGSSSTIRSNAMTVYKSGIADFGNFINLNKASTGAAILVNDAQALWYDGTYFSWGYGGTYNYFADKVTIGNAGNPDYMLYVQGSAYSTGGWAGSDLRWKKNLEQIQNVLPELGKLQGVKYNWRTDEYPGMNFEKETQIGLVAQEVEKIFPDLVRTDDKGYKAVSYEKLSVILLEGIKEQQEQIESSKQENLQLKSELQLLREEIELIKTMLAKRE